jgi:splicing suppressor protein 51
MDSYEPYCYHCYRSESQLEHGTKLNACQNCDLTSFCTSCPQDHPSEECATLQDVAADDKILVNLQRQTGKDSVIFVTLSSQTQCQPLSSATDWYDYYTRLSDKALLASKMTRDLKYLGNNLKEREYVEYMRHGTNTTSTQLTLLAALEATIPNLSTRHTISIHRASCFRRVTALASSTTSASGSFGWSEHRTIIATSPVLRSMYQA